MDEKAPTPKASEAHEKALVQFVECWGEMASAWGINKTMSQIHALLYAEMEPLDTDSIMERLKISRGNANMNIHKLIEWGLVHKVPKPHSRKDFYTAEQDVWNTAATIIKERQEREITPVKDNLKACLAILETGSEMTTEERAFRTKIDSFLVFLDIFQNFTDALLPYVSQKNMTSLNKFVKLAKARNLLKTNPKEVLR